MAPSLIDLLRAATRHRVPLPGSIFICGGEPRFMVAKAKVKPAEDFLKGKNGTGTGTAIMRLG
jgi:hypothetical protein